MPGSIQALGKLKTGQKGNVVKINARGELGRRIRDMGLIPGMNVQIVGRAPLLDPMTLRFANTSVAMRRSEACSILISED